MEDDATQGTLVAFEPRHPPLVNRHAVPLQTRALARAQARGAVRAEHDVAAPLSK
jgi:hypothetical protein